MTAPSASASGRLTSLHDVVLDYVNHYAYASTARVLSRPRRGCGSSPITGAAPSASGETNGSNGTHGGPSKTDDDAMDIDMTGSTMMSTTGSVHKHREKERLITEAELVSVERRRVILNHILNGAIMRAVEAINAHFPTVLDEASASASTSATAPSRHSPPGATDSWTPSSGPTPPHLASRMGSTPRAEPNHSTPVFVQSTHPAHVKLNLQIQSFIESFRNLAPSSPSTPSSSISSLTSSMHMSGHLPHPPANNGAGTNGSSSLGAGPIMTTAVTLTNALTAAQGLHAEAKKLPPDVRAVYLQEIKDVGALFAYTDPEESILKGFLAQNRRIALAEQVNLAILSAEGRPGPAFLSLIAERTSTLAGILQDRDVDPRPSTYGLKTDDNDPLAEYWRHHSHGQYRFDLHEYVDETWS